MQEAIRTKEGFCLGCGGEHEPDPADAYVIFRGYKFSPPFYCICCGKEICGRQFAFGRCCGACDMGACDINSRVYSLSAVHGHPSWWRSIGHEQDSFLEFVKFCKAQKVEAIELEEGA